jgi:hypothetical protein
MIWDIRFLLLQRLNQFLDFGFDQIPHFTKLCRGHVPGVGNLPVHPLLGEDQRAFIATAHRDGDFDFFSVEGAFSLDVCVVRS